MILLNSSLRFTLYISLILALAKLAKGQTAACGEIRCIIINPGTFDSANYCGAPCATVCDTPPCTGCSTTPGSLEISITADDHQVLLVSLGGISIDPCCEEVASTISSGCGGSIGSSGSGDSISNSISDSADSSVSTSSDCNGVSDGPANCFSSMATAVVKDKGVTPIKDIEVGDEVLTGSNEFKKVFTIDHKDPLRSTSFLQIYFKTTNGVTHPPLEITASHMLFVEGKKHPVPASKVKVDDKIKVIYPFGDGNSSTAPVTDIRTISRDGVWNLITTDGTIVVDGVVASTYSITFGGEIVKVGVDFKIMSHHDFLHMMMTPYRTFCTTIATSFCDIGDKKEYNGYSWFGISVVRFALNQPRIVQDLMIVGSTILFFILSIAFNYHQALIVGACIIGSIYYSINSEKEKQKHILL